MKLCQDVCLDKVSDEFKYGSCWVKNRSLGQILEKSCVQSKGHIFSPIIMKLGQNVSKSRSRSKMGHVGSKTRSLGQISKKPRVHSRDQIFGVILMKLAQNVCPDDGSCWVKK